MTPSDWHFGPDGARLRVRNAEALLAHLPFFLAGWPFGRAGPATEEAADIEIAAPAGASVTVIRAGPGGGRRQFGDAFDAAAGLADALVGGLVAADPALVCVAAGGAEVSGGLVVLLGAPAAGKSSVALHLAATGHRLFGEDRLALRRCGAAAAGMCLGLTPRVRLPMPRDAGAAFVEFVDGFTELRRHGRAYLKLWSGEAAEFGELAPVAAFVVLDRLADGPDALAPAARSDVLGALDAATYAPHLSAAARAASLSALADAAPGYRLRFADSRRAAARVARELTAPRRERL